MPVEELLGELEQLGVRLWLEDGTLKFRAPSGTLSGALLENVKEERAGLIRILERSPLTIAQYALWLHQQWDPGTPAYNIGFAMELRGDVRESDWRSALNTVVQRHPTLRSVLIQGTDGPVAEVRDMDAELRCRTVAPVEAIAPASFLKQALDEPFDLTRDVLLRGYLFDCTDGRRWFLLVVHHFAADAASFWQVLEEIGRSLQGLPLSKSKGASYAAAARREARLLAGPAREALLAKYRADIADYATLLDLPNDFPYPKSYKVRGASIVLCLDGKAARVRELGKRLRATPYVVLMAVFGVWIHRLTGQQKFLVGSPMSGREELEYADTVGHFVNVLPIRMNLADEPGFDEVVAETRRELLARMADRAMPLGILAAELDVERHPSRAALLQVVFGWQSPPVGNIGAIEQAWSPFGGLKARPVRVPQQEGAFELIVDASETPSGMELTFKYNGSVFNEQSIRRYAQCFERILDAALEDPETPINALPWTTKAQADVVSEELNEKPKKLPYENIVPVIERNFVQHAERISVSSHGRSIDYRELGLLSGGLAASLVAAGVEREDVVAIVLEPCVEMVVAALGVMRAGAAYLPIDPGLPDSRIVHQLIDSGAKVLICSAEFAAERCQLLDVRTRVITCDQIQRASFSSVEVGPEAAAYLVYTSGSTGKPKGVVVEHRGLANLCAWHCEAFAVTCEDRATKYAGWSFDASVWEIFPYLTVGASLHVVPADCRVDVAKLGQFLDDSGVTVAFLPTPICERFLSQEPSALRLLLTGGDTLQSVEHRGNYTLINNYGPTEATVVATSGPARLSPEGTISIGRPIANTQVFVLTPDGTGCPVGVFGELCIAGLGLAREYHGNPDETRRRFCASSTGRRMYRTGDRARWLPNGELEFRGRFDRQVKIRGIRIELGEVEHVLSACPGVAKVIAVLTVDESPRLVAYYEGSGSCDPTELVAYAKAHLPAAAVPTRCVRLDELPVTANGKLDLRALPALGSERDADDEATFSELELELARLWKMHLRVPHLQRTDGFFELGGNSLLAAKLAVDVGRHFRTDVPAKALVDAPDFQSFCGVVAEILSGKKLREREVTAEELWTDSKLANHLMPDQTDSLGPRQKVIVTGATGFVGSFLLAQILQDPAVEATCLVRALGPAEGRERLRSALDSYGIDDSLLERVRVVPADLTKERMGLDAATYAELAHDHGQIFHCAAWVNFTYSYGVLKEANVMGTLRVLELACTGPLKKLHLISAGSVAEASAAGFGTPVREDDPLDAPHLLTMGYAQSKWVAERLVQSVFARGLPGAIYRLGLIWGDVGTGVCNLDDMALRCVLTSLGMGYVPRWQHDLHFTTVDFTVRAVVALAAVFERGEVFHLTPREPLSDRHQFELLRELRPGLKQEPYASWRVRVLRLIDEIPEHPLAGVRHYFREDLLNQPLRFDNSRARAFLDRLGITEPSLTSCALRNYLNYFAANGLFAPVLAIVSAADEKPSALVN